MNRREKIDYSNWVSKATKDNISLSSCKARIEFLENINQDLLGALKGTMKYLDRHGHEADALEIAQLAISKAEGGE